jgi:hypothetical protein
MTKPEGVTYHSLAQSAAEELSGGRFAKLKPRYVTGASSGPPPLAPAIWSADPVPMEPTDDGTEEGDVLGEDLCGVGGRVDENDQAEEPRP